jgi:uncharacterized protein YbjT (DUF2867 family)
MEVELRMGVKFDLTVSADIDVVDPVHHPLELRTVDRPLEGEVESSPLGGRRDLSGGDRPEIGAVLDDRLRVQDALEENFRSLHETASPPSVTNRRRTITPPVELARKEPLPQPLLEDVRNPVGAVTSVSVRVYPTLRQLRTDWAMSHSRDLTGKAAEARHVLVIGATGKQGGALARSLLRRGHHVRAISRHPEGPAASELKALGVEFLAGDLGDRPSVERAAKGTDVAFLMATPFEQGPAGETRLGITGLDAIRAAGVPYVVYSSVADADRRTGVPHFESKARIEEHLKGLGTDYAIVAPAFFSENLTTPWLAAGLAQGVFATGVLPERKIQVISVPELAEFTTLAVEDPHGFRGKRINLASEETTPSEMTRQLSEVLDKKITYRTIPVDEVRKQSDDMAKMYDWFNRVGYSADIERLRHDYPQVHWRTFMEWATLQDWSKVAPVSATT